MSMLDESESNLTDLTDFTIIDTVRSLVLQQDDHASYITISRAENGLNGVVSYRAEYLAYNKNINALVCLFDAITLETISTFFSICKFPNGGF